MALFRNDSPGALTFEQAVRKAQWLEELQRRRTAADAYRRQGRPVPPELEDETPPEDFSKPEEFKRFTNDSPGALTLDQAVERHMAFLEKAKGRIIQEREAKAEAKARAKKPRMAAQLAAEGRGGDTEVAHVTPGEMVIPRVFQTPEVLAALAKVAAANGVPLDRFRVGDARNSVNPKTGAPEFIFDDTWHGALQLPSISNALANASNPMLSGNPWWGLTSGFDRWTSMPINIDYTGAALGGNSSIPTGDAPYRYEGPVIEEVKITAPPLPQAAAPEPYINNPGAMRSYENLDFDPNGPLLWDTMRAHPLEAALVGLSALGARVDSQLKYGQNNQNGEGDAWRHGRWNQLMASLIGPQNAKLFADSYERSNPTAIGPRLQDLYNNDVGRNSAGQPNGLQNAMDQGYFRVRPF